MTYGLQNTGEGRDWKLDFSSFNLSFLPLLQIDTVAATAAEIQLEQIKHALSLGLPRLHELQEFGVPKGNSKPAILVGGGPSLKDPVTFKKLYDFYIDGATIFACGSSNDWLIDNGIIPDYTVVCDPDEITALYLDKLDTSTTYLVASCCHKVVFDILKNQNTYLWHCYGGDNSSKFEELDPGFQAVHGGCTVGLRTMCIAIVLGYNNLHFFGFDSSLADGEDHHAYDFKDETREFLGEVHPIKLGLLRNGEPFEKNYKCLGYHIGQADQFKKFYEINGAYFTPTFHGSGLLPDLMDLMRSEAVYLQQNPSELMEDWRLT